MQRKHTLVVHVLCRTSEVHAVLFFLQPTDATPARMLTPLCNMCIACAWRLLLCIFQKHTRSLCFQPFLLLQMALYNQLLRAALKATSNVTTWVDAWSSQNAKNPSSVRQLQRQRQEQEAQQRQRQQSGQQPLDPLLSKLQRQSEQQQEQHSEQQQQHGIRSSYEGGVASKGHTRKPSAASHIAQMQLQPTGLFMPLAGMGAASTSSEAAAAAAAAAVAAVSGFGVMEQEEESNSGSSANRSSGGRAVLQSGSRSSSHRTSMNRSGAGGALDGYDPRSPTSLRSTRSLSVGAVRSGEGHGMGTGLSKTPRATAGTSGGLGAGPPMTRWTAGGYGEPGGLSIREVHVGFDCGSIHGLRVEGGQAIWVDPPTAAAGIVGGGEGVGTRAGFSQGGLGGPVPLYHGSGYSSFGGVSMNVRSRRNTCSLSDVDELAPLGALTRNSSFAAAQSNVRSMRSSHSMGGSFIPAVPATPVDYLDGLVSFEGPASGGWGLGGFRSSLRPTVEEARLKFRQLADKAQRGGSSAGSSRSTTRETQEDVLVGIGIGVRGLGVELSREEGRDISAEGLAEAQEAPQQQQGVADVRVSQSCAPSMAASRAVSMAGRPPLVPGVSFRHLHHHQQQQQVEQPGATAVAAEGVVVEQLASQAATAEGDGNESFEVKMDESTGMVELCGHGPETGSALPTPHGSCNDIKALEISK